MSDNGLPPSKSDVSEIDVDNVSRWCRPRGKVATNVVGAVDIINDDFNLTDVVVLRRC